MGTGHHQGRHGQGAKRRTLVEARQGMHGGSVARGRDGGHQIHGVAHHLGVTAGTDHGGDQLHRQLAHRRPLIQRADAPRQLLSWVVLVCVDALPDVDAFRLAKLGLQQVEKAAEGGESAEE